MDPMGYGFITRFLLVSSRLPLPMDPMGNIIQYSITVSSNHLGPHSGIDRIAFRPPSHRQSSQSEAAVFEIVPAGEEHAFQG